LNQSLIKKEEKIGSNADSGTPIVSIMEGSLDRMIGE
jgi:hypothetical protein